MRVGCDSSRLDFPFFLPNPTLFLLVRIVIIPRAVPRRRLGANKERERAVRAVRREYLTARAHKPYNKHIPSGQRDSLSSSHSTVHRDSRSGARAPLVKRKLKPALRSLEVCLPPTRELRLDVHYCALVKRRASRSFTCTSISRNVRSAQRIIVRVFKTRTRARSPGSCEIHHVDPRPLPTVFPLNHISTGRNYHADYLRPSLAARILARHFIRDLYSHGCRILRAPARNATVISRHCRLSADPRDFRRTPLRRFV